MDCSNKENSEKVTKEAISRQSVKKKYFSHITDKSVPLRRNSLKEIHVLAFIIVFVIIVINSFYQPSFNL